MLAVVLCAFLTVVLVVSVALVIVTRREARERREAEERRLEREREVDSKLKFKVRMYLKDDGPTIEGVLAERTETEYIIWAPCLVTGEEPGGKVEVSGHVEIPREQVSWYQVVG